MQLSGTLLQNIAACGTQAFPGFAYVVLLGRYYTPLNPMADGPPSPQPPEELPEAPVKIGYSNSTEGLIRRWQSFHRKYHSKITPIAVAKGGSVMESLLHSEFESERVSGELFDLSSEQLAALGHWIGVDLDALPAVSGYLEWTHSKEADWQYSMDQHLTRLSTATKPSRVTWSTRPV